jgi:hypothetical protein
MMFLLRMGFAFAFVYCAMQAQGDPARASMSGDLDSAFWLACTVVCAVFSAIVWAPFLGEQMADPITGGMTNSEYREPKQWTLALIRHCERHDMKKAACYLCFLQGVRRPWLPSAFLIGLRNAEPGSWFEKVFAREVYRFNNVENTIRAYKILLAHGVEPAPHKNPGVNVILSKLEASDTPDPEMIAMRRGGTPAVKRNRKIQIGVEEEER